MKTFHNTKFLSTIGKVNKFLFKRKKMLKKCCHCKIEKPIADFSRDKSRWDGLCIHCKMCAKKFQAEYRRTHKKVIAARQKAWLQTPKGKESQRKSSKKYCESYDSKYWPKKKRK